MSQNHAYREDLYIKPDVNLQFIAALALLGLPLLLLFMVFSKPVNDTATAAGESVFKPLSRLSQFYD